MKKKEKQKNVCEKWGISREVLQIGVEQYSQLATGKFCGDTAVLCAILELLTIGDIPEDGRDAQ